MGQTDDIHHSADGQDLTMPDQPEARSSSKPLLFYKLMVASILQDNKLKIPGKVVKRIEQELSIVVTISDPDGRKWNVKLEKDGGKCWFGDGWVEFMKHYNVRVGFLLVFRYKGDSTFVVNIFNLNSAEIQYLPDPVNGCERVGQEKHCSAGRRDPCVNADAQRKLVSKEGMEEKTPSCLLAKVTKPGNEGSKKLAFARENEGNLPLIMNGKESGNDDTQKMAPQGLAKVNFEKYGFKEVQLEKQCSKSESDSTMKGPVPEMTRQDKQCSAYKAKEVTLKTSGSRNISKETSSSVANCHTEPAQSDSQKKSNLSPPAFGESLQKTSSLGRVLSPSSLHNNKGGSFSSGTEKGMSHTGVVGSPSSFSLVKDVTLGYYRDNIMSSKKKKLLKTRKAKDPRPANPGNDGSGFLADRVELISPSNDEVTPEVSLIKMAHNGMTDNNSSTTEMPKDGVISKMRTTNDGDDKKISETDKMNSETPIPKQTIKIPSTSQLNSHTPVKRKNETNIADLVYNTAPITAPASKKVDVSTAEALNSTLEKTASVIKKQKTVQLSAISTPPVNPYCMIHMRYSYVQKKAILNIPFNFASKYLQSTSGYAILQNVEGERWRVRIISGNNYSKLSQGWVRFAADNHLKEGDICIFELIDSLNTVLKVGLIRSPKDLPPAEQEVLKL